MRIFDVCKNRTNGGSRLKESSGFRKALEMQLCTCDGSGKGPFLCPASPSVSLLGCSELMPESAQTAPGKASVL